MTVFAMFQVYGSVHDKSISVLSQIVVLRIPQIQSTMPTLFVDFVRDSAILCRESNSLILIIDKYKDGRF